MKIKTQNGRATGKTYRASLMALFKASEGFKVVIRTRHPIAAFEMLKLLVPFEKCVEARKRQISFPNGGRVIVCSPEDFDRRTVGLGVDIIHD